MVAISKFKQAFQVMLTGLAFAVILTSCQKEFAEFGQDGFIYTLNGERKHPVDNKKFFSLARGSYPSFTAIPDLNVQDTIYELRLTDDEESLSLYYYIRYFEGEGLYSLANGKLDSCQANHGADTYSVPNGDIYLHVLEWNAEENYMNAVFEARLKNSGKTLDITDGYINLVLGKNTY